MTQAVKAPNGEALGLQGGGAHGAFAWGVVDALTEQGRRFDRVCGVSSGALTAVAYAQGWARGGAAGAREEMARLWRRFAQVHALSPLRTSPFERWLWGWDIGNTVLWQSLDIASRLFSPAQLNPFGINPLRSIVLDILDRKLLASAAAPRLAVGVTDVETGQAVIFENERIDANVLLASCCLPFVFPSVRIDGRAYWDGGFSGNPPLRPLLRSPLPRRLVIARAQLQRRAGLPGTQTEIMNRLSEIACQGVLDAELEAVPASVEIESYKADDALHRLPISSKFNGELEFLRELFEAGRRSASSPAPSARPLRAAE
jgi:NTE family protein